MSLAEPRSLSLTVEECASVVLVPRTVVTVEAGSLKCVLGGEPGTTSVCLSVRLAGKALVRSALILLTLSLSHMKHSQPLSLYLSYQSEQTED